MAILVAENQRAGVKIIIPERAVEQERYAAWELRHYIGLMTLAQPETLEGGDFSPAIRIGMCGDFGEDGFSLVTSGDVLDVRGGKRGVIYGVYELLERLGCRFFTAECEKIPVFDKLYLPELDEVHRPALEYREHSYSGMTRYPRFSVKCRLNGAFHRIKEKFGGHLTYAWYVHSFETMVPPAKYAAEHPEYYALVKGERPTKYGRFQLCLTNPGVLEVAVGSVRDALLADPGARIISISQNDWGGNCECERCRAIDSEEGSPSGTLLRFVNAIAERLEPEFPDVIFDTLAYNYTRPAPKLTRPRHNVCVRLCSIECCFAHPFETCDDASRGVKRPDGSRSRFIDDLRDWGRVCDRMYIWDYTTCFAHYPTPHPNWRTLQPNMRAFIKNNVKGVFEQGNGAYGGGVDLNELRGYVISKLLWDADTDVERHMREFCDFYYGAAADRVLEYIGVLCDKVERDNIHVGFNDCPESPFLGEDMLDIYDEIFDRAETAVAGDPLRAYRVFKARLGLRYVRIKRGAMLRDETDTEEINRFFTDWRACGLTRMEEWHSPETSLRTVIDRNWRGHAYYEHWSDEGPEEA